MNVLQVAALVVLSASIFTMSWTLQRKPVGLLQRQLASRQAPGSLDERDQTFRQPVWQRVVLPFAHWLGIQVLSVAPPAQVNALRGQLARAGSEWEPEAILAAKILFAVVGAIVSVAIITLVKIDQLWSIVLFALIVLMAYQLPSVLLRRKAQERAMAIHIAFPSVLDLLTVSMDAGLGLDQAMQRIGELDTSVVAEEFRRVLGELLLGTPRAQALTAMAERNNVDELNAFVQLIVQTQSLGVGIADALRTLADDSRWRRRQRAEEAGHRAPVLMLFPMLGCILPFTLVILLGPAIISATHSLG